MIVYACAGALRTSLPLELIDNFCAYALSGPVHSNPFSNENGAGLLRFQKDLRPHLSFLPVSSYYNADHDIQTAD